MLFGHHTDPRIRNRREAELSVNNASEGELQSRDAFSCRRRTAALTCWPRHQSTLDWKELSVNRHLGPYKLGPLTWRQEDLRYFNHLETALVTLEPSQ